MDIVSKQIALADDAYESLKALRRAGESFTDVVRRLADEARRKELLALAGAWKLTATEAKRITDEIYAARRASRPRGDRA